MKTFKKFTPDEKKLHSAKCALHYNSQLLADLFNFILTKITDPVVINSLNDHVESLIENFDPNISKTLSNNETDDKANTY